MTTLDLAKKPRRIDKLVMPESEARTVLSQAAVGRPDMVCVDLTGTGAVQCLQGLVTNDIDTAGDASITYGALLTNKGMIVTDLWVVRCSGVVRLVVPSDGMLEAREIFRRSLPPRLARLEEPSTVVCLVVGPESTRRTRRSGLPLPEPGAALEGDCAGVPVTVARPIDEVPFSILITAPAEGIEVVEARLGDHKVPIVSPLALDIPRILAGWPRLGCEIDEKTLPQEVRFDDVGGVSYTKGCYVGQETVSRVHFRGHPNRHLRGLAFDREPTDEDRVQLNGRERGRVTSVLQVGSTGSWVGLAVLRREISTGTRVQAAGVEAIVTDLPHESVLT